MCQAHTPTQEAETQARSDEAIRELQEDVHKLRQQLAALADAHEGGQPRPEGGGTLLTGHSEEKNALVESKQGVIQELQTQLSTGMAKAAAALAKLKVLYHCAVL